MTCEEARPLLSAYLDLELGLAPSVEMERHVQTCARCAALLQQHEDLRAAARDASLGFTPPPGLERRIRARLRQEAGWRLAWRRWATAPVITVPAAAALAAVLAWSAAVRFGPVSTNSLTAELVASHIRSLMADHLVDVASSDQHTVKPWFNGKIDFAPPVADYAAGGFPLVGGRVDYVAEREVAVLIYRRRRHVINVFIWPAAGQSAAAPRASAYHGYHLLNWRYAGLTYWAVSDVSGADLESLARLLDGTG